VIEFRNIAGIAAVALAILVLGAAAPALAVGGEGESWPSFNESDGCGSPWSIGPNAETMGHLDPDTLLRGPQAAYFGRTIGQVADSLVPWAVPMSDGEVLQVHTRTLPALQKVAASLAEATDRGWTYDISSNQTFGYTSRTVGSRYRVSQHSFGNAVDINSWSNPLTEGSTVTDMPIWFVKAWIDAGFCWGGNWIDFSDSMHFSWRGPGFASTVGRLPHMYEPLTSAADFSSVMYRRVMPRPSGAAHLEVLMDADGDSAVDIVSFIDRGGPTVVEILSARSGYAACATTRFVIPDGIEGSVAIPGDWDADGIADIWIIDDTIGIAISPLLHSDGFSAAEPVLLNAPEGDRYLTADFNVDGWSDLYVLRRLADAWSLEIRSGKDRFESILATAHIRADEAAMFTVIDRNLDLVPDLVAIGVSTVSILDGATGFLTVTPSHIDLAGVPDIAGTDFDGDGRHDLAVLGKDALTVYAGNTPLDGTDPTSWFLSPDFACGQIRDRISGS
jgi:hypothetical protein